MRCGREPNLRACAEDEPALKSMASCAGFSSGKVLSARVRKVLRPEKRFAAASRCSHSLCHLRGGGTAAAQYFCPAERHEGQGRVGGQSLPLFDQARL